MTVRRMRRCVVLGGAGFLGSALTRRLLQARVETCVVDRPWRRFSGYQPGLEFAGTESLSPALFREILRPHDVVFHLWSDSGPEHSKVRAPCDVASTVVPTLWLLEHCARCGVQRIVFASSGGAVYGETGPKPIAEDQPTEPVTAYGVVKLAIEKYLEVYRRASGVDYVVLRIANAYGPGLPVAGRQNAVGAFLGCTARRRPLHIWGRGDVVRDFVYSEDVVDAFLRAAQAALRHRVLNIGTGAGTSILELIALIEEVTGVYLARRWQPARSFDLGYNVLDCSRAACELNWHPRVTLKEGLHATWRWLCEAHTPLLTPGLGHPWGAEVSDDMQSGAPQA